MKEKYIGLKIILAAFIVFICSSWLLWFFLEKYADTMNYENRQMTAQPRLTLDTYKQFPKDYTSFFNDNIPFRNNLVTLNNSIDYFVFNRSTNTRVAIGEDNWLFYCDTKDGDPIACYQGENLLSGQELRNITVNCLKQRDYLASLGKEFVIFIAPNKERMYSEYMPKRYGAPAENYRALQIVNYLRKHTNLRIVYPYEELIYAKNCISDNIYYKTDTHWNPIGAYVGSQVLLQELGIDLPSLDSGQITISSDGNTAGDLANFLGLVKQLEFADQNYYVEGYNNHSYEYLGGEFNGAIVCSAMDADPRKLYLIRDSFASAMIPFLGSQFNDSYFRHRDSYTYDDFLSQDPNIVVYETVERYIYTLASFSIQPVR